jgi:hypothetical protein
LNLMLSDSTQAPSDSGDVSDYQMRRMERQVAVLERTATQLIQR